MFVAALLLALPVAQSGTVPQIYEVPPAVAETAWSQRTVTRDWPQSSSDLFIPIRVSVNPQQQQITVRALTSDPDLRTRAERDASRWVFRGLSLRGSEIAWTSTVALCYLSRYHEATPCLPKADGTAPESLLLQPGKILDQVMKDHSGPKVDYPSIASSARIVGQVMTRISIAPDGTVQQVRVVSAPPILVPSTVKTLQRWHFPTITFNGQPTAAVMLLDINFTPAMSSPTTEGVAP